MNTKLRLFLDWGITFEKVYEIEEHSYRKVYYANKEELEKNIVKSISTFNLTESSEKIESEFISKQERFIEESKNKLRT